MKENKHHFQYIMFFPSKQGKNAIEIQKRISIDYTMNDRI